MSPSGRGRRAAVAPLLLFLSQACVTTGLAPADLSISQGTRVYVTSSSPFGLTRQTDSLPAATRCCVTSVDGRFVRAAGDTIVLERGAYFEVLADGSRIPSRPEVLKIARTPETVVTTRQTDRARTTALILVIAAALVGLAALGASQIEYDFPQGN